MLLRNGGIARGAIMLRKFTIKLGDDGLQIITIQGLQTLGDIYGLVPLLCMTCNITQVVYCFGMIGMLLKVSLKK